MADSKTKVEKAEVTITPTLTPKDAGKAPEEPGSTTEPGEDPEPNGEGETPDESETSQEPTSSEVDEWKAFSRQWEDRAKARKSELDALTVERSKDLEKITALETENAALKAGQADLLRESVAAIKGVPAHRIVGTTREELEADADKFLTEINARPGRGYVPTSGTGGDQPVSSVTSGRERAREALGKS